MQDQSAFFYQDAAISCTKLDRYYGAGDFGDLW